MDELNNLVEELLAVVREGEVYQIYRREEEKMKQNPELLKRVDEFRANNFYLQQEADGDSLFEVTERLQQESLELRRDPQVNAYLDAELALCKLLQQVCKKVIDGVEIRLPQL